MDWRPDRRNKAAFSNFSGVVWTVPKADSLGSGPGNERGFQVFSLNLSTIASDCIACLSCYIANAWFRETLAAN